MAKDAKFKISAEDKTKDALKSASSGLSRLAKSATLAGVAAGAAAVGGLALLVKATLPAIDNLGKTADSLGLTTEALISLRQGAQLSGVSVEVLDKALLRFNRAAGDAQIGSKTMVDEFGRLGISIDQVRDSNPEELLGLVAEGFKKIESPSERARIGMNLFGREGAKMLKVLADGQAGLDAFRAESEALGITLSRDQVAQVEAANDAMQRLGQVGSGAANQLTVQLAPALTSLANAATSHADDIKKVTEGIGNFVSEVIERMLMTGEATTEVTMNLVYMMRRIGEHFGLIEERGDKVTGQIIGWEEQADGSFTAITANVEHHANAWVAFDEKMQAALGTFQDMRRAWMQRDEGGGPPTVPEVPGDDTAGQPVFYGPEQLSQDGQRLQSGLEQLMQAQLSERDLIQLDHEDKQRLLDEALQYKLISEQGYAEQSMAVEKNRQDALNKLSKAELTRVAQEKRAQSQRVSDAAGALANLLEVSGKHNQAALAAAKAIRVAQATIDTYAGANLALATIPPPAGFVVAGTIIATGLANVASILSAGSGGGGGGGGAASVPASTPRTTPPELPAAQAEEKKAPTTVTISVEGHSFSVEQMREIADKLSDEHEDGYLLRIS